MKAKEEKEVKSSPKSVYEVENKELLKYKDEFNKTPFASTVIALKKILGSAILALIVGMVLLAVIDIIAGQDKSESYLAMAFNIAFWILFIFSMSLTVLEKVTFFRWLRIKYHIEY